MILIRSFMSLTFIFENKPQDQTQVKLVYFCKDVKRQHAGEKKYIANEPSTSIIRKTRLKPRPLALFHVRHVLIWVVTQNFALMWFECFTTINN